MAQGPGGAGGVVVCGGVCGAGAVAATGAKGAPHLAWDHRVGASGAGRRLWGREANRVTTLAAPALATPTPPYPIPPCPRQRAEKEGLSWRRADRMGSPTVLTTEGVPMQRGWVGTGPEAQWVLSATDQALHQPPLGLPELVLIQGPWGQGIPGPQAESSFPFPGGERALRLHFRFMGFPTSCPACPPLAGVAFTVLVLFTKEAFAIEAGHLIPRLDVPEHLYTGCVPICRHKLGARLLSVQACWLPLFSLASIWAPRALSLWRRSG